MPRFSANIGFMFNEVPFVDRYAAAAQAGFRGIECPFPYEVPPDELAQLLPRHGVEQVLCNLPPDGMAAIPGQEEAFAAGLQRALTYARACTPWPERRPRRWTAPTARPSTCAT